MGTTLTDSRGWKSLKKHYQELKNLHLKTLFEKDKNRGQQFLLKDVGIYFDYSKHRITDKTMELLLDLADERAPKSKRNP